MTSYAKLFVASGLLSCIAACSETSAPDKPTHAVTLTPVSPTTLVATVGSTVSELPSVLAQDALGHAVGGVAVLFTVYGGGLIVGSTVTTSSAGVARLAAWTLGTLPGPNKVTATSAGIPPVTFTVNAATGPAAILTKVDGDNQVATEGKTLSIVPSVRLTDKYSNPVANAGVTFDILDGGGSVTGGTSITDSTGLARLGTWTLGRRGSQVMRARAGSLPPVFFSALAYDPTVGCVGRGLGESQPFSSSIDVYNCERDGRYYEAWEVETTDQRWLSFALQSSQFDPLLEVRDSIGRLIAKQGASGVPLRALVPAGSLIIVATTNAPGQVGNYVVRYGPGTTEADCDVPFVTRGVSRDQQMIGKNCANVGQFEDKYRIYLEAGANVTIRIDDKSYSDPQLELIDDKGEVVASGAQSNFYTRTLSFNAPAEGVYTIRISVSYEEMIRYTLTVS